jgi:predicted PurR-regulated permease PerM
MHRAVGTFLVAALVLAVTGLLLWLVIPQVSKQASALVRNIPDYLERLRDRTETLLSEHPAVQREISWIPEQATDLGQRVLEDIHSPERVRNWDLADLRA